MSVITKLKKTLKEAFTFEKSSDYIYQCLNCKEEFDGAIIELFLTHQFVKKHFDYTRKRKEKSNL